MKTVIALAITLSQKKKLIISQFLLSLRRVTPLGYGTVLSTPSHFQFTSFFARSLFAHSPYRYHLPPSASTPPLPPSLRGNKGEEVGGAKVLPFSSAYAFRHFRMRSFLSSWEAHGLVREACALLLKRLWQQLVSLFSLWEAHGLLLERLWRQLVSLFLLLKRLWRQLEAQLLEGECLCGLF